MYSAIPYTVAYSKRLTFVTEYRKIVLNNCYMSSSNRNKHKNKNNKKGSKGSRKTVGNSSGGKKEKMSRTLWNKYIIKISKHSFM